MCAVTVLVTATNSLHPTIRAPWFLSNWFTVYRGTCVWRGWQTS